MNPERSTRRGIEAYAADRLALTKPRVTALVLFTSASGILLAPGSIEPLAALVAVLATAAVAGACSCFNMVIERERDGRMSRTRHRPIPAGRVDPRAATLFGLSLMAVGFPGLYAVGGPLCLLLGAAAPLLYVAVYTPLTSHGPFALFVRAVSGAAPILIGYAVVTGSLDRRGVVLFALLYAWQIPHFLSISLMNEEDYRRAGLRVHAVVFGRDATRRRRVYFGSALWLTSMIPATFVGVGPLYAAAALLSGLILLMAGLRSLRPSAPARIDRTYFLGTLAHVTLLLTALVVDALFLGPAA